MGKNKNKPGKHAAKAAPTGPSRPPAPAKPPVAAPPAAAAPSKLSALQLQFAKKLEGSRFRVINEQLYTSTGTESFTTFQANPTLFDVYHQGFREQASHWPHNPLDSIIAWLRSKHPRAVVADMGCGDARLSVSLTPQNKVHSFDLVAPNPNPRGIIACDIARVPLPDNRCIYHSIYARVFISLFLSLCVGMLHNMLTSPLLSSPLLSSPLLSTSLLSSPSAWTSSCSAWL